MSYTPYSFAAPAPGASAGPAAVAQARGGGVQNAIAYASRRTGMDFNYLLGQAQVESGLRADARAGTSSARGLYQFIEQSWLRVMKQHGADHGLGWAADAIKPGANGRMTVSDPATRRAILDLRNDPTVASLMAAEHAGDNKAAIEGALGRPATGTDLYMAHFLGLGGARSFLTAMQANPDRSGAAMFPAAAKANRNVFFTADGQPRSLAEIYNRFTAKLEKGAGVAAGAMAPAQAAITMAAMQLGDATVIPGSQDSTAGAAGWARAVLDEMTGRQTITQTDTLPGPFAGLRTTDALSGGLPGRINPLRPTPDAARLAYMMLASLGS